MSATRVQSIICLVICLSLAACTTVGPNHQTPQTELPPHWNNLEMAATERVNELPEDLSRWWRFLEDPVLSELIEEALLASPDLRLAQARLREARARRMVAVSDYYPTVTASGSAIRSQSSEESGSGDTRDLFQAGFDAAWEIDIFGRVRRSVEASEADLEATEADLQNTRVSLAAEVATTYFLIRSLETRLSIARDNLTTQAETLQLTQWREQAGLVSSQDVEQARTNMEQTRAGIPGLENSLAESKHRLNILLGKTPGSPQANLDPRTDLPAIPDRIAIGIPADTLRRRPDIRAAERRLAAETARVGIAEAQRYPSFQISGSLGLEALTLGGLGNSGAGTYSLLGGITAPVFQAGRLKSQVEIQDAVREQAFVTYEQTVLTALEEVENALVALARYREEGRSLGMAADSAQKAADMALQRYTVGLIDFQAVLDTERTVLNIEDNLATSRTNAILALVRLYKAFGGGWTENLAPPPEGVNPAEPIPAS